MSKKQNDSTEIVASLQESLGLLIEKSDKKSLTPRARRALEEQIRIIIDQLAQFLNDLDPVRQPTAIFDPSNPKVIGRFVSLALVAQGRTPLAEVERFYGSGVYAIYYKGPFQLYAPISGTETPIY